MIYLDNSATTRPSAVAVAAATDAMAVFGNPSSLHKVGVEAFLITEDARKAVAAVLSCRPDEILFTSGGTESNNLALLGGAKAKQKRGNKVVLSAVEHDSVMASAALLEEQGFRVVYIPPKADGSLSLADFESVLDKDTVLVSCMMVNNETGARFPVEGLRSLLQKVNAPALLHIDAVQAFGKEPIDLRTLSCDLMTLSAHKIHGLKGCGALYVRKGVTLPPRQIGGHQEKGLRAGTENVVGIAAFGAACKELSPKKDGAYLRHIKETFVREVSQIPGAVLNLPPQSAPHILNVSFPGYRSETLLHALEQRDIYVSSGSACKKGEKSHVLVAQGLPAHITDSTLRISLSTDNREEEALLFAETLRDILTQVVHVNPSRR